MVFAKRAESPYKLEPSQFQAKNASALRKMKVPLPEDINRVIHFPKEEMRALSAALRNAKVDMGNLAVEYTTQPPISRDQLIGVASAKIYLASSRISGKDDEAFAKQIVAILEDYKRLMQEKFSSAFVEAKIGEVLAAVKQIQLPKQDLLTLSQEEAVVRFNRLLADYEAAVKAIAPYKNTGLKIYKKLEVDLSYLREMDGFINNTVKKVQSVRDDLNRKYAGLMERLGNIKLAIEESKPEGNLEKAGKIIKGLIGLGFISSATLIAARGELMEILTKISNTPNLIYAGAALLVGMVAATFYSLSGVINAWHKNYYIKKYERKMDRLVKEGIEYTRKNLKMVGFKATKEAAFAGYLESLQGRVSEEYLHAAYVGDFEKINKIYERQIGSRARWKVAGFFKKRDRLEGSVEQEVIEADGHFSDILSHSKGRKD